MILPETFGIFTTICFGLLAVYFAILEEKHKRLLQQKDASQKHRIYEISILREIQERIGYELDIERVVDVITGSIKNLFPYSTTSSLLIKDDGLVFHTYVEETVSHAFLAQVKQSMLASLSALLDKTLSQQVKEVTTGVVLDDGNNASLSSFFHIPLVINDKVVGLLNISSTKPGLYKENEMTILYQIANLASNALSRLTEVLQTEKGKLLATIGSMQDGLFMVDRNNQLSVVNDAAVKLLKIQKRNPNLLDILGVLQSRFDIGKALQEAFLNLPRPVSTRAEADGKAGTAFAPKEIELGQSFVRVYLNPVIDQKTNTVIGVSVLLHDITLQKNLLQLKEDFTNMVVHELRAPLTAIKGASQLMTQANGLGQSEQVRLLSIIQEQSNRLLEEVSSLLDAAKLESGKFTIEKEKTDLGTLISGRLSFFAPQIQTKHLTLEKDIKSNLPQVSLDPFRIGQVINNLVSNSIKFTPEGGKITVKAKYNNYNGYNNYKNYISVSISDTGIGIPPDRQKDLFTKFSQASPEGGQAHSTQLAEGKGTGLGLFIAKGIVEAHGGKITLQSEFNKGTTITFTIPYEVEQIHEPITHNPPPVYYPPPSQIYGTAIN